MTAPSACATATSPPSTEPSIVWRRCSRPATSAWQLSWVRSLRPRKKDSWWLPECLTPAVCSTPSARFRTKNTRSSTVRDLSPTTMPQRTAGCSTALLVISWHVPPSTVSMVSPSLPRLTASGQRPSASPHWKSIPKTCRTGYWPTSSILRKTSSRLTTTSSLPTTCSTSGLPITSCPSRLLPTNSCTT